ncbi:MAG: hypothetical protein QW273_00385 [Candidatus Pacearchaeota archaeon]
MKYKIRIYNEKDEEVELSKLEESELINILKENLNIHLPYRKRLPDTRKAITHKFSIGEECEGYITVGLYEDGKPGEMFLTISKEGSMIRGLADTIGILFSLNLQYGVPLENLVRKLKGNTFEPKGYTKNEEIRYAKSIIDYIGNWLEKTFIKEENSEREK